MSHAKQLEIAWGSPAKPLSTEEATSTDHNEREIGDKWKNQGVHTPAATADGATPLRSGCLGRTSSGFR